MFALLFDSGFWYDLVFLIFIGFIIYACIKYPQSRVYVFSFILIGFIGLASYCGIQLNYYYTSEGGILGKISGLISNNTATITVDDNIKFDIKNIVLTQEKNETYSATIYSNDILKLNKDKTYSVFINNEPINTLSYDLSFINAVYRYNFFDQNQKTLCDDQLYLDFAFYNNSTYLKLYTNGGQNAVNYWNNYISKNNFIVEIKESFYNKDDELNFGSGDVSQYRLATFIFNDKYTEKTMVKIGDLITPPDYPILDDYYVSYWTLNNSRVDFNTFKVYDNHVFEAVLVPFENHTVNIILATDDNPANIVNAGTIEVIENSAYISKEGNYSNNVLVTCQDSLSFDVNIGINPEFILDKNFEIFVISDNLNFQDCVVKGFFNDYSPVNTQTGLAYTSKISFKNIKSSATVIIKVNPKKFNLDIKLSSGTIRETLVSVSGLEWGKEFNLLELLSDEQILNIKNSVKKVDGNPKFTGLYTKELSKGTQYYDSSLNTLSTWKENMYAWNNGSPGKYVENSCYDSASNTFYLYVGFSYL